MTSKDLRYPATTAQVARLLGLNPATAQKWARTGKVKVGKTLGGQYRWPRVTVENLERRMMG